MGGGVRGGFAARGGDFRGWSMRARGGVVAETGFWGERRGKPQLGGMTRRGQIVHYALYAVAVCCKASSPIVDEREGMPRAFRHNTIVRFGKGGYRLRLPLLLSTHHTRKQGTLQSSLFQ